MGVLLDLLEAYERGEITEDEFRKRFLREFAKRHNLDLGEKPISKELRETWKKREQEARKYGYIS